MAYVECDAERPVVFGNPTSSFLWRGVEAPGRRLTAPDLMGDSDKIHAGAEPDRYRSTAPLARQAASLKGRPRLELFPDKRHLLIKRAVLARRIRPIKPAPICRTTPIIHPDATMYWRLRCKVWSNTTV
jgi:hypothetical protein